jgi:hypothetical protein
MGKSAHAQRDLLATARGGGRRPGGGEAHERHRQLDDVIVTSCSDHLARESRSCRFTANRCDASK